MNDASATAAQGAINESDYFRNDLSPAESAVEQRKMPALLNQEMATAFGVGAADQTERSARLPSSSKIVRAGLDCHESRRRDGARIDEAAVHMERASNKRPLVEHHSNIFQNIFFGQIHQGRDQRPERKSERVLASSNNSFQKSSPWRVKCRSR